MSGACNATRVKCCGVFNPPLSNTNALSLLTNTPDPEGSPPPTPTALTFTTGVATSTEKLTFTLSCESNVALTFVGTLYSKSTTRVDVEVQILLALAATPDTSIVVFPYQVPPIGVTLVSDGTNYTANPVTVYLPYVLPTGTYAARVQVLTRSVLAPGANVYMDGVLYESYTRTYA